MNQLGGTIADYGIDWDRVAMKVNGETPITITLNETLQEGDQIAITGFRYQDDNATGTLYIKFNGSAVAQTQNFNNKAFNPNGIETKENTFVFTVTSATAGNDGFQLTKDTSGAEIYITSITVIGGLGAQRDETTSDDSTNTNTGNNNNNNNNNTTDPTVNQPAGTKLYGGGNESTALNWDTGLQLLLDKDSFSGLTAGSIIRIAGIASENWQAQLYEKDGEWSKVGSTINYWTDGYWGTTGAITIAWQLTDEEARAIQANGVAVQGYNFTLKYVTYENPFSATPTAAWSVPASTTDAEITSSYATITGGKMYVTNGQTDARDLIKNQGGEWAFQHTHNNTFFKVELYNALQAGDVISVRMQSRTDTNLGLFFSTATSRPSSATAQIVLPQASAQAWTDGLTYTVAAGDGICGVKTFYIYRATGKSTYFNTFTITRAL